jgi:hypothetical protein
MYCEPLNIKGKHRTNIVFFDELSGYEEKSQIEEKVSSKLIVGLHHCILPI